MTFLDTEAPDAGLETQPASTRIVSVLWPSFVMAGILEMLVFAVVDPTTIRPFWTDGWLPSAAGVYTLAFLVFWVCITAAVGLTLMMHTHPPSPAPRH